MRNENLEKAANKIPLTDYGVWWDVENADFQHLKNGLLAQTDLFEKICKWLEDIKKIKSINKNKSSYTIKHIIEKEFGEYVSNGIVIAAAIHCGFKYEIYKGSPTSFFNMSNKSLNDKRNNLK
jgi:hypothetical protein